MSEATKLAFSHESLNWKWMLPMGKTVPWNLLSAPETSGEPERTRPFSRTYPNFRLEPSTRVRNSVARGCTWGVLIPQGSRKPTVVEIPRPVRMGKDSMFCRV